MTRTGRMGTGWLSSTPTNVVVTPLRGLRHSAFPTSPVSFVGPKPTFHSDSKRSSSPVNFRRSVTAAECARHVERDGYGQTGVSGGRRDARRWSRAPAAVTVVQSGSRRILGMPSPAGVISTGCLFSLREESYRLPLGLDPPRRTSWRVADYSSTKSEGALHVYDTRSLVFGGAGTAGAHACRVELHPAA